MRSLLGCVVVLACAGFSPAGACAKGCKGCASGGDDIARVSSRSADDFAATSRFSDDLGRGGGGSRLADDFTRGGTGGRTAGMAAGLDDGTLYATRAGFDDAISVLPEASGTISPLARKPTPGGLSIKHQTKSRSFGRDYARSIDKLKLEPAQHEKLLEAFDHVQTAVELVVDLVDDDTPKALSPSDRRQLQAAARKLEAELDQTLDPTQKATLVVTLGTPAIMSYRIATERPITR